MRTRSEILTSINRNPNRKTEDYLQAMIDLLLDIRDLLAEPLIEVNGVPFKGKID